MTTSDNNSIEPFLPPLILPTVTFFTKHQPPFIVNLLGEFNNGMVRDQIVIPISVYESYDILSHCGVVPKRGVLAMSRDGQLTALRGNGLLRERHSYSIDICFQVGVH
jgi:hypothetical protein